MSFRYLIRYVNYEKEKGNRCMNRNNLVSRYIKLGTANSLLPMKTQLLLQLSVYAKKETEQKL